MSKKSKFAKGVLLAAATAGIIAAINKFIFIKSTAKNLLEKEKSNIYSWRFGDIFYTKIGHGKPLLLIHDLKTASSGYEWNKVLKYLSKSHTVYAVDLLGCGRSHKPNLTYTNFLYVQLLTDFIKSVIGHRADVIATGSSCAFVITACNNNSELFDKIVLINPDTVLRCGQTPNKYGKGYKFLIDLPVIGTLIYNIANSRRSITDKFSTVNYSDSNNIEPETISIYHESAHLGDSSAKALYASIKSNYTCLSINHSLKNINNSIFIIGGEREMQIQETIEDYCLVNPAIEYEIINETAHLPQMERPEATASIICDYLDVQ
ncbi:alpha/beta fold hydrolase [Lacrimispora sp. NSJ-141]|uniref:Alpha/beta fold hydrolase n=1 Tax=Lientehia hominis TaxID=2897778 RepID=A0AAP2RLE6_9FIRM|nr:alpha/beta fold hydrolase [Lientehia hominis]MCD2493275.1 alpha/beta fold hydrolase [Lientehia hominis]